MSESNKSCAFAFPASACAVPTLEAGNSLEEFARKTKQGKRFSRQQGQHVSETLKKKRSGVEGAAMDFKKIRLNKIFLMLIFQR